MSSMYDFSNDELQPEEHTGQARMREAGIVNDIQFVKAEYVREASKKDATKTNTFARLTFMNSAGEIHEEMLFEPEQDPLKLTFFATKWTKDDAGRMQQNGKHSAENTIALNNLEVAHFLIDLADALGYTKEGVQKIFSKCTSFEQTINAFIKHCPTSDKKRISVKFIWDNNPKGETSFLKIKTRFLEYYPFGADKFDVYIPGRATKLAFSEYDITKGVLIRQFAAKKANAPDGKAPVNKGTKSNTSFQPSYNTAAPAPSDDDPF